MKRLRDTAGMLTWILGTLLAAPLAAQAAVWPTENAWSPDWENRYAEWVKTSWDQNFFARPDTPYTGLKLDCADVVYSMRIVFAYENRLPFAMKDPTGGKKLITNEMSRWDHLPKPEQRIRQFLLFVFGTGSTQSLPQDTVPVAVNRQTVRSGALILTDKESHHSWTIKDVFATGIPHLIYSSRPAKTTLLVREGQPSLEFTFRGKLDSGRHAGFRGFRRIEDLSKPVWQAEGYSDEQYKIPAKEWMFAVKKKLALVDESLDAVLRRALETACTNAKERVVAVSEGLAFLAKLPKDKCLNATEYDNYSTPNRDMRLRNSFEELRDLLEQIRGNPPAKAAIRPELLAQAEDVMSDVSASAPSARTCPLQIAPGPGTGKVLSLAEVRKRSLGEKLSNNPHDPLEMRWGGQSGPSARAKRCPVYE